MYTHCQRCGRELKDAKSRDRGFGPTCWARFNEKRQDMYEEAGEEIQFPVTLGGAVITQAGITVLHSAMDRKLQVRMWGLGTCGKQQNEHPVGHRQLEDGQVRLDMGSSVKPVVPLADWRAFVDRVEVHVSATSRTTIPMSPHLVKMARDVIACRRKAPTDEQWAAEMGNIHLRYIHPRRS